MSKTSDLNEKNSAVEDRIQELNRKIAELKKSRPAHSISPSMLQQLEDLEEELERAISSLPPAG